MSAHELSATVVRPAGESFERVALECSCGVPVPTYRRTANRDANAPRNAAGFRIDTPAQVDEMRAHARQAHARQGANA